MYNVIPVSTEIILTKQERKHYLRIGIGMILIWFVGITVSILPSLLISGPFYLHHAQSTPVTIVEVSEIRGRKTLSYDRVSLVANINGENHDDVWTVPMSWFDHGAGETVNGEWYQDDGTIQLGVSDVIHPFIRWYTIAGILAITLALGVVSMTHLRLATKKKVFFRELSFIDKQLRVNKVKK